MDENERSYRKTIGAIGFTMLIFAAFILLMTLFSAVLLPVLPAVLGIGQPADYYVYELLYAAVYLATFLLPVLFLRLFLKAFHCPPAVPGVSLRLSPYLPLLILAGIAISNAAIEINDLWTGLFDYNAYLSGDFTGISQAPTGGELVLDIIVVCVVPGVCEEFLFRGGILTALRPYGRTNAILISSFLFAMMHENIAQFFFTFVGGILFGLLYEKTGNLLNNMLFHMSFNLVSTLRSMLYYLSDDYISGNARIFLLEFALYFLGAVSIAVLAILLSRKRNDFHDGVFDREIPASDGYAQKPVEGRRAFRLFWHPALIAFLAICTVSILRKIIEAVIWQYVPF